MILICNTGGNNIFNFIIFILVIYGVYLLIKNVNFFYKKYNDTKLNIDEKYNFNKLNKEKEINRILDKINRVGYNNLTTNEKNTLKNG